MRCLQPAFRTAVVLLLLAVSNVALAGSHLWRFSEFFSTADGAVQFVEMVEIGGSNDEFHLSGKRLYSDGNTYTFPNNLPPTTANRKFLMGTESYAQLGGVPAPDYVIPDNFFDPASDTLMLDTYDIYTFTAGALPDNGYHSLDRMLEQVIVNSPTNFAGNSTVIDLSPDVDGDGVGGFLDNCVNVANAMQLDSDADDIGNRCDPDVAIPNDCLVNFLDLEVYKSNFFQAGVTATDNNGDGQTNFLDLEIVLSTFFGPPGPSANGCN